MRTITRAGERGFTLMEMLISLVLVGIVAFGLFRIFTTTNESYKRGVSDIDGQQNVRAAVSWMGRELRGAKGFNLINADEITFLSDEHVRNQMRTFRLDRTDRDGDGNRNELLLIRNPNDDGTAGVFTDEIAVGIDSLAFVYRDAQGAVTTSRPTVREVELTVRSSGVGFGDEKVRTAHAESVQMGTRVLCRNLGKSVPTGGDVTPPNAPSGIGVNFGCGTATVHWLPNSESDLAGYFLHYSQSGSGPPYDGTDAEQGPSPIYVGNATSYTLTGLTRTSTYAFGLVAVDAADNASGYSTRATGTPTDATPPAAPTDLTGRVVGNDRVQLDWTAPANWDLAGYRVRWYDEASPLTVHTDSTTATSITITGLTNDAVYTFRVFAVDGCGNQGPTTGAFTITMVPCDQDVTFPDIPANVGASQGDGFVRLTWNTVPDTDVVGYQIYFHNAGQGTSSTLLVPNVAAYTVHGLYNGESYDFQVAARDGCGHIGGYSGTIAATPTACAGNVTPPIPPTNVQARDSGTGDAVRLAWSRSSETDALGYRVYWGPAPGSWTDNVDVASALFHTVNGLTAHATYYFSVSTYDVCGNESSLSTPVSAIPTWGCACPPTVNTVAPADYAVLAGTVQWTATAAACSSGTVAHVEFQVDGTARYVDYSSPFEFGDFALGWTTSLENDGPHTLVTEVVDANGCSATDTTHVFVDNSSVGPSCVGLVEGEVAQVAGTYGEQMTIHALNLSSIDTYHWDGLILTWTNPSISPQLVALDGTNKWVAAGNPGGATGDSLRFSARKDVSPQSQVLMKVVWQKYPGPPTTPFNLASAGIQAKFYGSPIPSCGPYVVPFAPPCSLAVTITAVNSTEPYNVIRPTAGIGQVYYTDRTYTVTYQPTVLNGSTLVRTPQADKNKGDSHALQLRFYSPVAVYIAYDPRGTPPNWIRNNFTSTGLSIGVTDTGTATLGLWKKNYDAGVFTFSGNKAAGWGGGVNTNYVIFVTCQ